MIFPGFPGVLSFFQVFQVEWEPWNKNITFPQLHWQELKMGYNLTLPPPPRNTP